MVHGAWMQITGNRGIRYTDQHDIGCSSDGTPGVTEGGCTKSTADGQ